MLFDWKKCIYLFFPRLQAVLFFSYSPSRAERKKKQFFPLRSRRTIQKNGTARSLLLCWSVEKQSCKWEHFQPPSCYPQKSVVCSLEDSAVEATFGSGVAIFPSVFKLKMRVWKIFEFKICVNSDAKPFDLCAINLVSSYQKQASIVSVKIF